MDRILGKYGWKEGDGLGKRKQGRKHHVRVQKRRKGKALAHDPVMSWANVFNQAARSVVVGDGEGGVAFSNVKQEEKKPKPSYGGMFVSAKDDTSSKPTPSTDSEWVDCAATTLYHNRSKGKLKRVASQAASDSLAKKKERRKSKKSSRWKESIETKYR